MIYLKHREWKNYLTNNTQVPEWSKNTPVSGCPGLMNYVTDGLVILSDHDYEFETEDGHLTPWSFETETNISTHKYEQAGIYKPGHTIVKFNTGLMARHEEKYRLLCLISDYEPLDSKIRTMSGVFPLLDIWSPMLINTVFPNGHHKIKRGDPIARLFITYAGDFQFVDEGLIEPKLMMPWWHLAEQPNVLSTFNKEMKKCPFHHSDTEGEK